MRALIWQIIEKIFRLEIDQVHEEAYESGRQDGQAVGYSLGYTDGAEDGREYYYERRRLYG